MGYASKVQSIKRGKSVQWVINFPAVLALALNLKKSETIEWEIEDKNTLVLKRRVKKQSLLKRSL